MGVSLLISNLSTSIKEAAVMAPKGSRRNHGTQDFKKIPLKWHILTVKLCHRKVGWQDCAAGVRYAIFFYFAADKTAVLSVLHGVFSKRRKK